MSTRRRLAAAAAGLAVAGVALSAMAGTAGASFHLVKIREVSGDMNAASNNAYVELQMYAAGQNFVAGQTLAVYDEDAIGGPSATFVIPSNVAFGGNQRTILIGDTNVPNRDITWDTLGALVNVGNFGGSGALCFLGAPDCVSWGAGFTGAALLPDGATPFPASLPVTAALRRSIAPGCPTLLEGTDDTNIGAADFVSVARDPTPNAATPSETPCQQPTTPVKKKKKCKKKKKKRGASAAKKKRCKKKKKR